MPDNVRMVYSQDNTGKWIHFIVYRDGMVMAITYFHLEDWERMLQETSA